MVPSVSEQISGFIRAKAEAQLQFVIDLCDQNSYTTHAEGTNRVAEMILDQLKGLFHQHEVIKQTQVGHHHILRTTSATPSIYLLGHLDTVFPPDHPFQKCRRQGDWLIGPGTGDMKGGLAVIVYALKALARLGQIDRLGLTLILGGDEEIGSATSHSLYQAEARKARVCLVAECAGPEGQVVTSRNGKAGARLDCFGQDHHVAELNGPKASAIVELAHQILALETLNDRHPDVNVNVGRIEGGLGPSTVPAQASCLFDMRWKNEKHYHALLQTIRRIIEKPTRPSCRCELKILNHRPAMPGGPKTERLLARLRRVARSVGLSIADQHRRGTSDANFFGAAGMATIDGFGPICLDDHTSRERILISSLASRTTLLALFLHQLASDDARVETI
jgi:glutamate carboxypeptidase